MDMETLAPGTQNDALDSSSPWDGGQDDSHKTCPFCAEQIQLAAIKCRYCHEFLSSASPAVSQPPVRAKWYFANGSTFLSLIILGPLALPLVWANPRYRLATKWVITVLILAITVLCCYLMVHTFQRVLDQIRALGL